MALRPRSVANVCAPLTATRHARGAQPAQGYRYSHSWELPFPEFPALAHINEARCTANHILHPHRHHTLEVCYFHSGRATWTANGRSWRLGPGDFFLARPGELHHGLPDPRDPNHNFAIGFDPRHLRLPAALDLDGAIEQLAAVDDRLRVVRGGFGAEIIFRRLLSECDGTVGADPLHRALTLAIVQALLVELLATICRCALTPQVSSQRDPQHPSLADLEAWLDTRLADPPTVGEMARKVGLAPSHFTVLCRRAFGLAPLELLTSRRIAAARRLLRDDPQTPVTTIAFDLGFPSSQYFSAVFRRQTGVTPSAWRDGRE